MPRPDVEPRGSNTRKVASATARHRASKRESASVAFAPRAVLTAPLAAGAVLDIGCGTGALLHWARESGHTGLAAEALVSFLAAAGFVIEAQYGDWHRSPVAASSPEIITIARVPALTD